MEYLPLTWLSFTGDPLHVVNSSFHVGTMAQTTIGLAGLSAAYYRSLISEHPIFVSVDARHAVIEFKTEAYHLVNGKRDTSLWNPLAGRYRTKGEHHIAIHTNFPHHRDGILKILECGGGRADVEAALQTWDAFDFENKAAHQVQLSEMFHLSKSSKGVKPQGVKSEIYLKLFLAGSRSSI